MSKIACVMTDMFEDVEFTSPKEAFEKEGHELTVISDEKGKESTGKQGEEKVTADLGVDDAKPEDYDALFIPGGFSPDLLRGNEKFVEFSKHFILHDKPVFAICHGPQLLITADVLHGRNITGFKSILQDLRHAGANVFDEEVVVCGSLVTSRTPNDLEAFNRESLAQLK
ncbi:type 1 glutamine amidotransferase domain-containing protein [Alkalicoccus saliphilus]|jgi:protease I|uniref:Protease n=1 Tax=Alkalicoccus saliphilus TaxID=200989 RepID=A0A2T4U9I2_9BACI|nr:type 1 glutamine amidotransferase domain-containing protein [Alkalicoccus saliphilus]PTL40040.1 protease [Alkalicoccus saliphilus]